MNSMLRRWFALSLLALSIAASAIHGAAQEKGSDAGERDKLIAAAREIMVAARYCALITLDAKGQVQARTMDPFLPDEDMIVWLATNPKTRKVPEITKNPHVVLYYFDLPSQSYVTISGTAVSSTTRRKRLDTGRMNGKTSIPIVKRGIC